MPRLARRATLALSALALVASLGLSAVPAVAQNSEATINQQITCQQQGNYQIGLGVTSTPPAVEFSASTQNTSANLELTAGHTGGCTMAGWKVTLVSSAMVAPGVGSIAAENVRANSLGNVVWVSGQLSPLPTKNNAVNNTPLNTPVMVMSAAQNSGMGTYKQAIALQLVIPGYSMPGTYATTLTATITVGPT